MALHKQVDEDESGAELEINPVYFREKSCEIPRYRLPEQRRAAAHRAAGRAGRAHPRRQRQAEPGDVRHHVDGAGGRAADGRVLAQEHDRQGRVPADRRARAPLREHPRPPVERAARARRSAAPPPGRARRACSAAWRCCGGGAPAAGPPGKHRDRPNLVMGTNVQVCWEKFCRYWDVEPKYVPMVPGRLPPGRRGGRRAVRREHDRRRGDHGVDDGRLATSRSRDLDAALDALAAAPGGPTCRSTSTARPAGSSRRSCSRTSSGTSGCRGSRRSTPRATSTAWSTPASAGSSGATRSTCPRT